MRRGMSHRLQFIFRQRIHHRSGLASVLIKFGLVLLKNLRFEFVCYNSEVCICDVPEKKKYGRAI